MDTVHPSISKIIPYLLVVGGVIGLVASIILTIDKIQLASNPSFQPICNINPLFSCVSVASSSQAEVFFGIPNSVFGIVGFSIVTIIGALVLARRVFPRWFWQVVNAGLLAAIVFIHWLIYQSVYSIGALCLFCMGVWVVTAALFWYTTLYNLQQGYLPFLSRFTRFTSAVLQYHDVILVSWYSLIVLLIFQHFWFFFRLALPGL